MIFDANHLQLFSAVVWSLVVSAGAVPPHALHSDAAVRALTERLDM